LTLLMAVRINGFRAGSSFFHVFLAFLCQRMAVTARPVALGSNSPASGAITGAGAGLAGA
jgi:hypothetical protein